MPLSATLTTAESSGAPTVTWMVPSAGVYLIAFTMRFVTICWTRTGSASTQAGSTSTVIWCRAVRPDALSALRDCVTISARFTGRRSSTTLPRVTRATSSRSSTIRVSCSSPRPIT